MPFHLAQRLGVSLRLFYEDISMSKREELWELCSSLIEHNIDCGEAVYQNDNVSEDALDLIDGIREIFSTMTEENW